MFLMNNPGQQKQKREYINVFVTSKATLGHRLPFRCCSSLFRAGLRAKNNLWCKDQALNEWFTRQNTTATEFVPLNSFLASVPCSQVCSQSTEVVWTKDYECTSEVKCQTARLSSMWQRLSAQLLHVKTTQEKLQLKMLILLKQCTVTAAAEFKFPL